MIKYLLFSAVLLISFSSCKKGIETPDDPNAPMCPVSNSLIDKEDYTLPSGFSATRLYSYDSLHRVINITNFDSIYSLSVVYKGLDTSISYSDANGDSTYRIFNLLGERIATTRYLSSGIDAIELEYNASKEIQIDHHYIINSVGDTTTADVRHYQWLSGNIDNIIDSLYGYIESYEYLTGTNGEFVYNAPNLLLPLFYPTKPVMSQNLVSKIIMSTGFTRMYTYTFDNSGRVKTMTLSDGYSHTFHYKCF